MKNKKKLGAILISLIFALQTTGCGNTESPVNTGSTQNDIPASEEAGQSSVGNQGNTSEKVSDEDLQQTETDAENMENTDDSKVLIAYFTAGENSDVDVVSSARGILPPVSASSCRPVSFLYSFFLPAFLKCFILKALIGVWATA